MRVKEAIFKIKSHPMFYELDRLISLTEKEFYDKKMDKKFWLYPDYSKQVYYFKQDNITRQIPEFSQRINFEIGDFEVTAFIRIQVNEYDRKNASIRTQLTFKCDRICEILWNSNDDLPVNLDLENPVPQLKKIFKKYVYEEGYWNRLQYYYGCTKKETIWYHKQFKKRDLYIPKESVFKWIKKNFNIESCLDIDDTIKYVNKHGKQDKLIKLMKFDYSFMWNFDGDIDEVEEVFWDEMSNYPKNAVLI